MEHINQIISFFQNLTLKNIIDLGIFLGIVLVFQILSSSLAYIVIKMFKFKIKDKNIIKKYGFYKPLKWFFVILGIYIGLTIFDLPEHVFRIITKIFKICIILLVTKGLTNLCDPKSESFADLRKKINFNGNDTTINFFSKVLKALIYILSGFVLITELGYNLGGLATGLGISSVVIALAAQDVAKSFLAGLSIISDRPFEIGEYIKVGDFAGTVEDITFRTTRIRNVDNQIVVLPNSILTSENIINMSKMKKRRYNLLLTLELDTPIEKVRTFVENIREILKDNNDVENDTMKIFFNTISENGIDVSVDFYTYIINYIDYLKFKEDINYIILDLANKQDLKLAYPSQSIYIEKE
ncbi:MAG: mechanosensitive ion channel family protein [Clostridia bacterium]|nr:mechanosensitive ion channel family protein [Clostridia bacterium]